MNKVNEYIQNSKKIAIISHTNPDADALCSCIALKNIILNNFDFKQIDMFVDGNIGELYDPIVRNERINPNPYEKYDLTIVLDCPNLERTGKYKDIIKSPVINIDHHETNEKFGDLNFTSSNVSSTCEYIYHLSTAFNYDLTNSIAKYIYQGIITDTNCFSSYSVKATTHKALSELLKYKFDENAIKNYYFKNNSVAKTILTTKALKSMKIMGDKFVLMKIDNETFTKAGANYEDTLGIVDNGINISGIEACAILIEQEPNIVSVSLRNKGQLDIAEIAKTYNGGGTTNAAAFQYEGDIKVLEKDLIEHIKPLLKDLKEDNEFIF